MRPIGLLLISCLASSALAQYPGSAPVPKTLNKGFEQITISDAKQWLGFLAGPECDGRGTGQPGYDIAAQYMADQFKKFKLKPIGDNGTYFQYNDFWRAKVNGETLMLSTPLGKLKAAQIGIENTTTAKGSLPLVVLSAETELRALPENLDLKGKLVVVFSKTPQRRLSQLLSRASVGGMVTFTEAIEPLSWRGFAREPNFGSSIPRLKTTEAAFRTLLSSDDLKKIDDAVATKETVITPLEVTTEVNVEPIVEKIKVANVVGYLEGSDPKLKDEYIGVGAHLDHLGSSGKTVYYGADDDGSGSTALLGVAKALTTNPLKPRRGVLFMAFYGEEMGLLGSEFLASNPPLPLSGMIAELQMDMVGRNSEGEQRPGQIDDPKQNVDTIRLVGSKRISTELDTIIQEQNKHVKFRFLYDAEDVYTRSDHYCFAKRGVPVAFLFDGFHPDYHQPTDTIEKINWDKLTNTAKLFYLTIHELSRREKPPVKDVKQ